MNSQTRDLEMRGYEMKIIICDDSIKDAELTKKILVDNQLADATDITCYLPETLKERIEEAKLECDIAIMDIEFDTVDYNGIDLSKAINDLLFSSQIIYVTNILEFAPEVYETRHCYFVLKSNMDITLPRAFKKAANIIKENAKKALIDIVSNGSHILIQQKDITYVERVQRKLRIHTIADEYSYYGSLKKFMTQVNNTFARCHEAYVVNLNYVSVVRKDIVQMMDGTEIPIGVSFEKSFRIKYMNYWANRV